MKLPDIRKIEECKYCGSRDGYYTRVFASGWLLDNNSFSRGFNGERIKENEDMYNALRYGKENHICYCRNCDTPIGKVIKF